jgi:hypothetical protein
VTIKAVFRVQCDGMCRGWLSLPDAHRLGMDIRHVELVVRPTAANAGLWPGERTARRAALGNGWEYTGASSWNPQGQHATARGGTLLCPTCKLNPLGIRLPPPGLERLDATRDDDPVDWMPGDRGWTG